MAPTAAPFRGRIVERGAVGLFAIHPTRPPPVAESVGLSAAFFDGVGRLSRARPLPLSAGFARPSRLRPLRGLRRPMLARRLTMALAIACLVRASEVRGPGTCSLASLGGTLRRLHLRVEAVAVAEWEWSGSLRSTFAFGSLPTARSLRSLGSGGIPPLTPPLPAAPSLRPKGPALGLPPQRLPRVRRVPSTDRTSTLFPRTRRAGVDQAR